jgi:hypothetical protein
LRHGWVYSDIIAGQEDKKKQRPSDDPPGKKQCGGGKEERSLTHRWGRGGLWGKRVEVPQIISRLQVIYGTPEYDYIVHLLVTITT